ncbi:MAG TPA: hypothetical protein VET85_03740 [Stellaceae bacterium]|nr:hypothetical protein [Stellaceae bacterium]
MPNNMLIHDVRLQGRSPTGLAQNIFNVPQGMSTAHVFSWASAYAGMQSGLDNIYIMCHGYETGVEDPNAELSIYALGYGLQLGNPGLTFDNLSLAAGLSGLVSSITLFACGPANTRTGYKNSRGDGMRFCGELALLSGAEVIAAVETQYYYHTPSWWDGLMGDDGTIDFGDWEGPVFSFSPDDGSATRVA